MAGFMPPVASWGPGAVPGAGTWRVVQTRLQQLPVKAALGSERRPPTRPPGFAISALRMARENGLSPT